MQTSIEAALFVVFLVLLGCSVYFSFKFRRQRDAALRGLYQSKQNISMGAAMILLSTYPLFIIPNSTVSIIVGVIFLLVGCFNLFAGLRNHSVYRSRR